MPLHELLLGGFEKPENREILLHDVDAVLAFLDHFDDLVDVASGLFEIDQSLFVRFVHTTLG